MSRNPPKVDKKRQAKMTAQLVFNQLLHNHLSTRLGWMRDQCSLDPAGRDLYMECGYPESPTIDEYKLLYEREGMAKRVVDIWPDETWSIYPELYDTLDDEESVFEKRWKEINKKIPCWHYLHRIDRLSGIGRYGLLYIGLNDGRKPDQPVLGINQFGERGAGKPLSKLREILYLKPFSEDLVEIEKLDSDTSSPRFGQPLYYMIRINDPVSNSISASAENTVSQKVRVHWSRVLHVADNRDSSEVYGAPRMRPVLNRLLDLRKILGSSAEMFYKGGFPGFSFEAFPELAGDAELDEDSIKEQLEAYMNGMKRYLAATGGVFKSLAPQVADPTHHVMQQVTYIAATMGTPVRILLGSESAHLASTQDTGNMNKKTAHRQNVYAEPMVARPFIDRLRLLQVMPEPQNTLYYMDWKDLNTLTDIDQSNIALKRAQALMQYTTGGTETIIPPREFLVYVLGFTSMEAEAILAAAKTNKKMTEDVWKQPEPAPAAGKPQGGGRKGATVNPGRKPQRSPKS